MKRDRKPTPAELQTTSIRVPPELWLQVRVHATRTRSTAQRVLAAALVEYLARRASKAS